MSAQLESFGSGDRLLTFEVGGTLYALPIGEVAEVSEVAHLAAVPLLPVGIGGVMNHHGDALPVVCRDALFDTGDCVLPEPEHLLVLASDPDDPSRYGVPVDSIVGLADGRAGTARGDDPVVERRPIGGRLVSVLDPQRLLLKAAEVIEKSVIGSEVTQWGEI